MKNKTTSTRNKAIGVCVSLAEAEFIDEQAAAVGLNRSKYMRKRLLFDEPVENTEKIDELIEALAIHNGKIDRLLSVIDNLSVNIKNLDTGELSEQYWGIMARQMCLQNQLFEVQKQLLDFVLQIRRQLQMGR